MKKGLICFLALNAADAAIMCWALRSGGTEANWYGILAGVMPFWAISLVKLTIASLLGFLIWRYKAAIFRFLNVGMGLIIATNLVPVTAYLIGRFG